MKYVLIITAESDYSTTQVMDWLYYYKQPFIVINESTEICLSSLKIENNNKLKFELLIKEKVSQKEFVITEKNIKSVWYRRGYFFISSKIGIHKEHFTKDEENAIQNYQKEQDYTITEFIYNYLVENYFNINKIGDNLINKLTVLKLAIDSGLNIPESYILTQKREVQFGNQLIIKSLNFPVNLEIQSENAYYSSLAELITPDRKKIINNEFPPALFQKYITKVFEIRTFYLLGAFYSMTIFSQNDEQTKVDFRNYNFSKPNRNVPYTLPPDITKKLELLFKKLNMNSGSADIIYASDSKYYFLEINPVGQYDMVSVPCNYNLHQKIAKHLSKNE